MQDKDYLSALLVSLGFILLIAILTFLSIWIAPFLGIEGRNNILLLIFPLLFICYIFYRLWLNISALGARSITEIFDLGVIKELKRVISKNGKYDITPKNIWQKLKVGAGEAYGVMALCFIATIGMPIFCWVYYGVNSFLLCLLVILLIFVIITVGVATHDIKHKL